MSEVSRQDVEKQVVLYRRCSENGEYLELHGGRRDAGDTLVHEIGWEQTQRVLRYNRLKITMNAYSHVSTGRIAEDAGDASDQADNQ
jgi:predicted GNAT family N-acyltransferase